MVQSGLRKDLGYCNLQNRTYLTKNLIHSIKFFSLDLVTVPKSQPIRKRNPILSIVNDMFIDLPSPTSLSYF